MNADDTNLDEALKSIGASLTGFGQALEAAPTARARAAGATLKAVGDAFSNMELRNYGDTCNNP